MGSSLKVVVKTIHDGRDAQNFVRSLEAEIDKEKDSLRGDGTLTLLVTSPDHVSGSRRYCLKDDDGSREYTAHFNFCVKEPDVTTFYHGSSGMDGNKISSRHFVDTEKLDPSLPDRDNVAVIQRLIKNARKTFERAPR